MALEDSLCFNRPQAIRCLATRPLGGGVGRRKWGFNRPQAIRCLATTDVSTGELLKEAFQSPAGDSLSCDYTVLAGGSKGLGVSIARRECCRIG